MELVTSWNISWSDINRRRAQNSSETQVQLDFNDGIVVFLPTSSLTQWKHEQEHDGRNVNMYMQNDHSYANRSGLHKGALVCV